MAQTSFGGAPVTANQSFDPSKDKTTPSLRALSLGGISGLGALAGTTGVDCELIHADCWQQITGNVTNNTTGENKYTLTGNSTSLITGSLGETINIDHDYKVLTNLDFYVKGTTKEEHVGSQNTSYSSSLTEDFTGLVVRKYDANTTEEHPEEWIEKVQRKFHFEPFKWEILGSVVSVAGAKVDVMDSSLCVRRRGLGVGAEEGQFKLNKLKVVNSEEELHESMVDTFALQMHLGAMDAGTPFKPNALPRPTPITPFD